MTVITFASSRGVLLQRPGAVPRFSGIHDPVDALNERMRTEKGREGFSKEVHQALLEAIPADQQAKIYSLRMGQMLMPLQAGRRAISAHLDFTDDTQRKAVMNDLLSRQMIVPSVRSPYARAEVDYYDFKLQNGLTVQLEATVISRLERQRRELAAKIPKAQERHLNGHSIREEENLITLYVSPGRIDAFAKALVKAGLLQQENGTYRYEGVEVRFKPVGQAVAY